ncbi:hypothetical protein [Paraglaciecola sp.]|uniref:hypothetical protein n=1 Tax=Paraglaciecola sp. TaxID=1920173 RepID=UPI003EF0DB79
MEYLSVNRARSLIVLILASLIFVGVSSCQSTQPENPEPDCSVEGSPNCPDTEDNGEDRAYNPCLVNKSLPVCRK